MLLSVSHLSKAYGGELVLADASFRIEPGEKVALVGRNGSGKTTLLRILAGLIEADGGAFHLARGAKIGYLRQEAPVDEGRTVLQEAEQALSHRLQLKRRLEELERALDQPECGPELLEEYSLVHEHFLASEGYSAERDVRTVLLRMGFEEEEFERPTSALSGGEKTRLALARMLLEEPDLLILDEPTNHLDLQATEWLEGWIGAYRGAALLVSHDRAFLENTAQRVLELRHGRVRAYPGPFAHFLALRAQEDARQEEVAKRQEQEIARLDEYVRRFLNSQRTAQARGREKMLRRLEASKVEPPREDRRLKAGFGKAPRSGDLVVRCERLSVGFPGLTLIKGLDWTVRVGERWGVVGENGAGKSTLIRTVLGIQEPLAGAARLGANVAAGYFSQDAGDLDPEMSPLDALVYGCDVLPAEARNLLARFLITGDDVYRPIRTLSGGEKNKLSLARLTKLNPNLLVLDEPTNHLDMDSREALADVLREFGGTLILVSHDRWLLEQATTRTLDVRRSGAVQYPGSYSEYRRRTDARSAPRPNPAAASAGPEPASMTPRELSKAIERARQEVALREDEVTRWEQRLRRIEEGLAAGADGERLRHLTTEHGEVQNELAKGLAAWEEAAARLERLLAAQGAA